MQSCISCRSFQVYRYHSDPIPLVSFEAVAVGKEQVVALNTDSVIRSNLGGRAAANFDQEVPVATELTKAHSFSHCNFSLVMPKDSTGSMLVKDSTDSDVAGNCFRHVSTQLVFNFVMN